MNDHNNSNNAFQNFHHIGGGGSGSSNGNNYSKSQNENRNRSRPTTPLLTSVTVEPKLRPSTTGGPMSPSTAINNGITTSSSMSDLKYATNGKGILNNTQRPMTSIDSISEVIDKPNFYPSASLPIVKFRHSTSSRRAKRKPPLPVTPNTNSRKNKKKDDNALESGGSSIIDMPAPATPRVGNSQCNTVVSVSRTLSVRESLVPEDIHADSIWEKKPFKTPMNTPNTFYISSTDNVNMNRAMGYTATSSATRPGTKGREISSGPVQYRSLTGRNEHNRYHHHSLNSGEKLRDIFNRSTTPMHEQQIYKQGKLRARLKPGVLLPMGLGERYSIEIMK